jgi:8-oxo-dGTP diphosphatase
MNYYRRIGAVLIQDKKMLFVKCNEFPEYFSPGGKKEVGESDEETLTRELKEEVGLDLISAEFFKEYETASPFTADTNDVSRIYLVNASGEEKVAMEIIGSVWVSKEDFEKEKYSFLEIYQKYLIPDLINKELL